MFFAISSAVKNSSKHIFMLNDKSGEGVLELVQPHQINQVQSREVLVESFTTEYSKDALAMKPADIKEDLEAWRGAGDKTVESFYRKYFADELEELKQQKLNYWVQVTINGEVAGWATFQIEKSDKKAIYMNLLAVHPKFQRKGVGTQLVFALTTLGIIDDLSETNVLIREKNTTGMTFYRKLGFSPNEQYQRSENFVDIRLLEPWTCKQPHLSAQVKKNDGP